MEKIYNMKKIKLIVVVTIMLLTTYKVSSQNNYFEQGVLEVKGKALFNGLPTSSYTVCVYNKGKVVDSMKSKSKRAIYFSFEFNNVYTILYETDNCDDKMIVVDTRVPKGLSYLEDDTHEFEIELSKNLLKETSETEDMPVAILFIDKKEKMLVLSDSYHSFIHNENNYALVSEGK
jgi:hypothetical protein